MAKKAAKKTTKKARKKAAAEPSSRGLTPAQAVPAAPPAAVAKLAEQVEGDGGRVVGCYRDPLGGAWQLVCVLPIDAVQPTPFQRDLSPAHVERLGKAVEKLDRFLDPIIVVRRDDGTYWTPNGNHRRAAMAALGSRSITVLLVPEAEMAYEILALNTEKAHNLKERSLEVIRMARELATLGTESEKSFAGIFEEPTFLTLGACYELRGRYAGSTYQPVLKRVDGFLGTSLGLALEVRDARAALLMEVDDAVAAAVAALKERGLESPYLKSFVVARINPLRGRDKGDFDEVVAKLLENAQGFDASKIQASQLARTGGAAPE